MNISDISKQYKVSLRTLRYYEELNLIKSERNSSNIREFSPSQVEKLEIILLLKTLNFSLKEIKELLKADNIKDMPKLLKGKINDIDKEMHKLSQRKESINTILRLIHNKGFEKLTMRDFIKEQIYISSNIERMINMNNQELIVEIGEKLIPLADKNQSGLLLHEIKKLREHIENTHKLTFDLIRVRDNPQDLLGHEYRILKGSSILIKENIKDNTEEEQVKTILKALEEFILKEL